MQSFAENLIDQIKNDPLSRQALEGSLLLEEQVYYDTECMFTWPPDTATSIALTTDTEDATVA